MDDMCAPADEPVDRGGLPRPAIVILGAAALIAMFVALLVLTAASGRARDKALERERHSYEIAVVTSRLGTALARSEAALGRFVASGDRRTGTAFYDEWRRAGRLIDRLGVLVADGEQKRQIATLRRLYEARRAELAPPAIRATYRQGLPALTLFARAGASETLPQIDRVLDRISEREDLLLGRRADRALTLAEWSNRLSDTTSLAGMLLMALALTLAVLAVRAYSARRIARDAAEAERDRAGALARAVDQRTRALSEANARLKSEAEDRRAAEAQRAEVEDQLRQMQKMEAVGQLTGGIAHDFNNMLSVVVGGLDIARRRLADGAGDGAAAHIDSALEGANRAAALTRQLLTFSRAEPLLPQAIDPGALAAGMGDLIDRTIGARIAVAIERPPSLWPVWVDRYQLENAILNLVVNARDAMDGAGRITIAAANEAAAVPRGGLAPGDYVRISVADEGMGMTAEVKARAFEPFFTTKPVGRGTGLGLSQIFGFARQSGGTVEIDSAPGRGTKVSILLPRAAAEAAAACGGKAPAPAPATPARGETILVVEDDPRVRQSTTAALAELGYRPVGVESAEAALARLDAGGPVALIVTDVMMPGVTGPELLRQAAARHGAVPALFVTGYVGGGAGDAPELAGHAVLRKPFTIAALAAAVATALAPAPADS